jgi:hypothetical protein
MSSVTTWVWSRAVSKGSKNPAAVGIVGTLPSLSIPIVIP